MPLSTACRLAYGVVTPVRNEAANLRRVAAALVAQRLRPAAWVVVDTGSTDETLAVARGLAVEHSWIVVHELAAGAVTMRGGPVVRAFHAGLELLPPAYDLAVKLDADTSFDEDYFDRLVAEFEADERLGIAGGVGYEQQDDGLWRQRFGTGPQVWGACRAYRRGCLAELLPLEERMGWDTMDLVAATVRGWDVRSIPGLPFCHHRLEGVRSHSRLSDYLLQGHAAHYMGYRPLYVVIRTLFRAVRDPLAVGISLGYLSSALRREERSTDDAMLSWFREHQRLRRLHLRAGESLRTRGVLNDGPAETLATSQGFR